MCPQPDPTPKPDKDKRREEWSWFAAVSLPLAAIVRVDAQHGDWGPIYESACKFADAMQREADERFPP